MNRDWLDIDVLEDYLDGRLDGKGMHFVEKQALEDPFIAEALEGLKQSPKRKQTFSILQKKLYDRIAEKPIKRKLWGITTHRLSIAAAATVVFLSVSILFVMRETKRKNAEVAQIKANGVIVNLDSADNLAKNAPKVGSEVTAIVSSQNSAAIDKAIADAKKDNLAVNRKGASLGKIASMATVPVAEEVSEKKKLSLMPIQNANPVEVAQADVLAANVSDSTQKSVDAANDKMLNEIVVVKAAGVRMKQSESEAKVSGIDAKMRIRTSRPRPGIADYDKYLNTNNKLLKTNALSGKVSLSFSVSKDGQPEDIKVVKSLSKEADAEAIRLVKEGPKWLLPVEGTNQVSIDIKF